MQLGKELGYRTWFGAEFLDCSSRSFDSAREDPISSTQRLSLSAALEGMANDALCLLPLLNFHGRQSVGLSNGTEALLSLQSSDPSHCPRVLEVS